MEDFLFLLNTTGYRLPYLIKLHRIRKISFTIINSTFLIFSMEITFISLMVSDNLIFNFPLQ